MWRHQHLLGRMNRSVMTPPYLLQKTPIRHKLITIMATKTANNLVCRSVNAMGHQFSETKPKSLRICVSDSADTASVYFSNDATNDIISKFIAFVTFNSIVSKFIGTDITRGTLTKKSHLNRQKTKFLTLMAACSCPNWNIFEVLKMTDGNVRFGSAK